MTLTPATPFFLGLLFLIVFLSVLKGRRAGFSSSAIRLARLVTSAFIAAFLSILLSNILLEPMFELADNGGILTDLADDLGKYSDLLLILVQMLLSAILYLPTFIITNLISLAVVAIVVSIRSKHRSVSKNGFTSERAPYYVKKDKLLGAIFGGISGVVIFIACLSPTTGIVRSLAQISDTYVLLTDGEISKKTESQALLNAYANDFMVVTTDAIGGGALYDLTTTVFYHGMSTNLRSEIRVVERMDELDVDTLAEGVSSLDEDSLVVLEDFINQASNSLILRFVLCITVNEMASAWLEGESYLDVERPDPVDNDSARMLVDSILRVLSKTDMKNVQQDVITFVRISRAFAEHSDKFGTGDYTDTLAVLISGSLIDTIDRELAANPNMKPVKQALNNLIMQTVSEEIVSTNYTYSERKKLFAEISDTMNDTIYLSPANREKIITEEVTEALESFGIEVQDGLAEKITYFLLNNFDKSYAGDISDAQIEEFFASFRNQ